MDLAPRPGVEPPSSKSTEPAKRSIFDKCAAYTRADETKAKGVYPYFRLIETGQDTEVAVDGRKMLMLGSNSYLELTTHPKVKARAIEAVRRYGTGCAGSRFLNGTLPLHVELEKRLAKLVGKPAALVYTTGYQTNTGVISCLVQRGEYILSDKLNHACILEGSMLSAGTLIRYEHGDMRDLERQISALPAAAGKLIVSDGVFSMEGRICKLPEITRLAHKYGAQVMLDDAHSIGVLGPAGAGTAAHFGLTDEVDLIMGTFSKSLAAIGGFVAASERVINYLKHHSRSFIFSASPPPANIGAALAALEVMQDEPERIERLWDNTRFLKQELDALGFDTGSSETPVIPIVVGEPELCFRMWRWLHDACIFVNPVVPPAVPPGRSLLRLSLTAGHTRQQLSRALEKLAIAGREFGLIGR
ncbi:MAG TPA: aminotransferase class I/II-fold pyridoxal phosphate-dependent enzyme [Gammaproteobacteria bacterium]|nr:aminotransferase class I/II-fold pyridoxal phosphate-dependent enzyme [Gammaproteobacteria bacterium]